MNGRETEPFSSDVGLRQDCVLAGATRSLSTGCVTGLTSWNLFVAKHAHSSAHVSCSLPTVLRCFSACWTLPLRQFCFTFDTAADEPKWSYSARRRTQQRPRLQSEWLWSTGVSASISTRLD